MYKHPILSYNRYKYEDARAYNIFSNEKQNKRNLDDIRIKHRENPYEQLANDVKGSLLFFKVKNNNNFFI